MIPANIWHIINVVQWRSSPTDSKFLVISKPKESKHDTSQNVSQYEVRTVIILLCVCGL